MNYILVGKVHLKTNLNTVAKSKIKSRVTNKRKGSKCQ
jgi:hypothetical protein